MDIKIDVNNIWKIVKESFNCDLRRTTAIIVKENDLSSYFTYPNHFGSMEYCFSFSNKTIYNNPPKFKINFAEYEFPDLANRLSENYIIFDECTYLPSLVIREFSFTNLGIIGTESLANVLNDSLTWDINIKCINEGIQLNKNLFSVLKANEEFSIIERDNGIDVIFDDLTYFIYCNKDVKYGLYENEIRMKDELSKGKLSFDIDSGYYLVISNNIVLEPKEFTNITFGLSSKSLNMAKEASQVKNIEEPIRNRWNEWFNSLPSFNFNNLREIKAYYKSWWTIKTNYYNHPKWGFSILEALPVYKGIWQWAIPSVEWYSDQNTDFTSEWVEKALNMLINNQREDGYITHAIYIDDIIPGEKWSSGKGIVQTPHLPWVAVRYYNTTLNLKALKRWINPLKRYYEYLCKSRDEDFENINLWAITVSFDTGLDTNPLFQKVTYGVNGIKEDYCYPSIFAAEKYRYEVAIQKIEELVGGDPEPWERRSKITLDAMNKYLWDNDKKWYGVRHQDGFLDTRVGVDGLFPLVYHLVDHKQAQDMKENFKKLIGEYGIRTFSPDEEGYREDIYWRGAAWPKSCSLGMEICRYYFSDLKDEVYNSILNMVLKHPNIWECYVARTGELARADFGFVCTPCVSSNVGAGDIIGSILIYKGFDMYGIDDRLPLEEFDNFHWKGARITTKKNKDKMVVLIKKIDTDTEEINFLNDENTIIEKQFI